MLMLIVRITVILKRTTFVIGSDLRSTCLAVVIMRVKIDDPVMSTAKDFETSLIFTNTNSACQCYTNLDNQHQRNWWNILLLLYIFIYD